MLRGPGQGGDRYAVSDPVLQDLSTGIDLTAALASGVMVACRAAAPSTRRPALTA